MLVVESKPMFIELLMVESEAKSVEILMMRSKSCLWKCWRNTVKQSQLKYWWCDRSDVGESGQGRKAFKQLLTDICTTAPSAAADGEDDSRTADVGEWTEISWKIDDAMEVMFVEVLAEESEAKSVEILMI